MRQTDSFTPAGFAAIYPELFRRHWGFSTTGVERMTEVFERLRELLRGSALLLNDQPIAVQILYHAEAPGQLSVEYINGGVDPQTRELSPGSVLSYLNTQAAWEDVRVLGKPLHYSFGRVDHEYKDRWCHPSPVFQV